MSHLMFSAMDLAAAANRRRRAAEMTASRDKPMRRRLLDSARFILLDARYSRLKREEAMKADDLEAQAKAADSAGEPIIAATLRNAARQHEMRAMSMPHPAFR